MHRVTSRTYVGQPSEMATLTTQVDGGGQITVTLEGQPIPANTQFPLPPTAGGHETLRILLVGPIGASCAVGIATVDGGTDGDFLMCQPHNPAPVNSYSFSAASQAGVVAFAAAKAGQLAANSVKAQKTMKAGKKR